ncbi:Gfo/Idh/MocA family oxidoreductase [Verrucomicrobiaceae bacterium N1E253]|uniref:Gfo/Idh/MocA family oxidoreductase n=1 Tax=Oceaniferula marina TaxID=2748318 RepID=A0A851GFD4_9BACT|nr:Gfo/Idh/MocA family oxidoreductase [Oceaniferula marina]NWK54451.1 Gfo/Idh/MocA family oxidoreductase [Oceaniferula marina]
MKRRSFLKTNLSAGIGAVAASTIPAFASISGQNATAPVRVGIVGSGNRARGLMRTLLSIPNVLIPAVCDINPAAIKAAQDIVTKKGQAKPDAYTGPEDYKKLMDRDDLDAVIIGSPWDLHTPMSVYAMKAGITVGCEVPIAYTLEECWELIKTHEETGTPCMMLENWSFRPDNLAVLKMIRQGALGTITHGHCAYSHNCINHWYFDSKTGNDRWGAKYLLEHNRAQYPTHQQGPMLSWMNIGCGDYYESITSTATGCFSINEYFQRHFPNHPNGKRKYAQGDIVTTVVKTKMGKSIVINYDMQSPRPYDNRWEIQGTRGIYNEQRNAISMEGKSRGSQKWEPFPPHQKKNQHRWASSASGGHGGADGLMINQFIKAIREKKPLPLSLYDGVLMSSIGPLSEASIAGGNQVVKVPDFTQGKWKTNQPYFAI